MIRNQHIDAGSLCRWADPSYRATYTSIFSGHPENHNSYNLTLRFTANQMLYPGNGQSTVLRCFQGWTALSPTAPRKGTIRLFPAVKWQIAYVLLRPFFREPEDKSKVLEAGEWGFEAEGGWFPGTEKETSQYVSRSSHPHLKLEECLVYAPSMEAGDTVWWHADVSLFPPPLHTLLYQMEKKKRWSMLLGNLRLPDLFLSRVANFVSTHIFPMSTSFPNNLTLFLSTDVPCSRRRTHGHLPGSSNLHSRHAHNTHKQRVHGSPTRIDVKGITTARFRLC